MISFSNRALVLYCCANYASYGASNYNTISTCIITLHYSPQKAEYHPPEYVGSSSQTPRCSELPTDPIYIVVLALEELSNLLLAPGYLHHLPLNVLSQSLLQRLRYHHQFVPGEGEGRK